MRHRIMLAALVGMVGTAAWIGYVIDTADARPRPRNYREAVERVLDDRRFDYRNVEVVDKCAPSYQLCRFYAGTVRIMATTTISGQIACRERWTTCTLTIPRAGISVAPLEDVRDPLFAHWEEIYGQFLAWLRSYESRLFTTRPSGQSGA